MLVRNLHSFPISFERNLIGIQYLHGLKVRISDTNNKYRKRQFGCPNDAECQKQSEEYASMYVGRVVDLDMVLSMSEMMPSVMISSTV